MNSENGAEKSATQQLGSHNRTFVGGILAWFRPCIHCRPTRRSHWDEESEEPTAIRKRGRSVIEVRDREVNFHDRNFSETVINPDRIDKTIGFLISV
jgi:hypothetical protein